MNTVKRSAPLEDGCAWGDGSPLVEDVFPEDGVGWLTVVG